MHEKDYINCLDEPYSVIGFGNGANAALYFSVMVNDVNENFRSVLLFNASTHVDKGYEHEINYLMEKLKSEK